MIIERSQKVILFEEAAKKGIQGSLILSVPEIFSDLLGITDIGVQKYGAPLAPLYVATPQEPIDIAKISKYFQGLVRDIKVAEFSLDELENTIAFLDVDVWSRIQLLKNRSTDISKRARSERLRTSIGATWIYTETFSTTDRIDMDNTTAWLDTAEGIALLPVLGLDDSLSVSEIAVTDQTVPRGGSFLGSSAELAFDGSNTSNWRVLFSEPETQASCIIQIPKSDLTFISIDPVGFGIQLIVETETEAGWERVINDFLYRKTSYPVSKEGVQRLRYTFAPTDTSLPKVVGIRESVLSNTKTSRRATVRTQLLKSTDPFTELKINYDGIFPEESIIDLYYRTSSSGAWNKLTRDVWKTVTDVSTRDWRFSMENMALDRGLYRLNLPSVNDIPVLTSVGEMSIGLDQVEVTAFRKDWIEEGILNKILSPQDFDDQRIVKSWSSVPFITSSGNLAVQLSGGTEIHTNPVVSRGGDALLFERRLDPAVFDPLIVKYNQLCIVPLVGNRDKNTMQTDYNYRMRYWVHAPEGFHFSDGKYWIYQGYRDAGKRPYNEIGKSYGSFAMYINGQPIASDNQPITVYTDRGAADIEEGSGFAFTLEAGWNLVEIFVNVVNPDSFGTDSFDVADAAYYQVSIYPSFFDNKFRTQKETEISQIVASGVKKPIAEFDLLWNVPRDLTFWSWREDRRAILFNAEANNNIDGYFYGVAPEAQLVYKGSANSLTDDLYLRLDLERAENTASGPVLDEFTVMVR